MNGSFNEQALAAIESEKDSLTNASHEVVITDDFAETREQVMELKRSVFDAICKSGLSKDRMDEAFNALIK